MKTYVVIVWYELFGRTTDEILYVGQDEYKAFNTDVEKHPSAEIEVWDKEQKIEHYMRQENKWRLL